MQIQGKRRGPESCGGLCLSKCRKRRCKPEPGSRGQRGTWPGRRPRSLEGTYLEELRVVGAVLAGLRIGALGAPRQLLEAGGRVEVAGVQLGEVQLWEVSAELLLPGPPTLRRQEGRKPVRAELGWTPVGTLLLMMPPA